MRVNTHPHAKDLNHLIVLAKTSKRALAEKLNVHPNSVSAWARGKSTPSADHMFHMAVVLGVPLVLVYQALGYEVEKLPDITREPEVDPELQGILEQLKAYGSKKMSELTS